MFCHRLSLLLSDEYLFMRCKMTILNNHFPFELFSEMFLTLGSRNIWGLWDSSGLSRSDIKRKLIKHCHPLEKKNKIVNVKYISIILFLLVSTTQSVFAHDTVRTSVQGLLSILRSTPALA